MISDVVVLRKYREGTEEGRSHFSAQKDFNSDGPRLCIWSRSGEILISENHIALKTPSFKHTVANLADGFLLCN